MVRRFREALLYVPRKNGKTPLVAAIALYVLGRWVIWGIRGVVRRAKLYYLRGRTGKSARIVERKMSAPKA